MKTYRKALPGQVHLVCTLVVLGAIVAVIFGLRSCSLLGHSATALGTNIVAAVDKAGLVLPAIAEKFRSGQITTTFISSLPDVNSTEGDVLELATVESDEFFRREDHRTTGFGWVNLGTTVAEIRARVTFRYHLKLSGEWKINTQSNICLVIAPSIQPSLPPAIHTQTLQKHSENGWARFDKAEQLTALELSMTEILAERAGDPRHIKAVRETCRRSVGEFVRRWLLREDHWRNDRFSVVAVQFADEGKEISAGTLGDSFPIVARLEN